MPTTIRVSALSLVLLTLLGCAAPPAKKDPRDPWERMNRTTYKFNDKVDKAVLRPIARGYQKVTPQFARTGISNFFDNLNYPLVIVNDLLQAKFKPFVRDTGRLVMNSTLGLAGFLDPATAAGLQKNVNDFGLTLARWGAGTGPYVVIPFLGPSDVRDGLGRIPDAYGSPQNYIGDTAVHYSLWAVSLLDQRYRLLGLDATLDSAYDPYLFMKNAYLQRRDFLVHGAQSSTNSENEADKLLDEAGKEDEDSQPQTTQPPQGTPNPDSQTPPKPQEDTAPTSPPK
jgi:phospholipid-binding lipoprotein MlaA